MVSDNPYANASSSSNRHVPSSSDPNQLAQSFSHVPYGQSTAAPPAAQHITYSNNDNKQRPYQSGDRNNASSLWPNPSSQAQQPLVSQAQPPSYYNNPTGYNHLNNGFQTQRQPQPPAVEPSVLSTATGSATLGHAAQQNAAAPNTLAPRPMTYTNRPPPASSGGTPLQPNPHGLLPVPASTTQGQFFILSADDIKPLCAIRQIGAHLDVSVDPLDISITKATIPTYIPRKSRNEIKSLLKNNSALKAKISKKLSKKDGGKTVREVHLDASGQLASNGRRASQTSSEDVSDESSEYESSGEEEEAPEKRPAWATRPDSVKGGLLWDTIEAAWRPRNRPASGDDIRNGLNELWRLVQSIRNRWKSDAEAVKAAEEGKNAAEVSMLKARVAEQRTFLEIIMSSAVKHGHPDIIKHCGENIPMMNALALSLSDRAKEGDFDSGFSKATLKFLAHCTTLTEANLDTSKLAKVLPRFLKGEASTKALVKEIQSNAALATKKRKESLAKAAAKPGNEANGKSVGAIAGVKRSSAVDAKGASPVKKLATTATHSTAKPSAADTKPAASTTPAAKPKVITSAASSVNLADFLKPASKKSGTSNAAREAAKKNAEAPSATNAKKAAPTSAAAQAQTASSTPAYDFAATLAGVKKIKDPEPSESDRALAAETEEQRAKRLRKQARRRLTVRFKPDAELEEVRLFHHDPDEELGHDSNQVRDAADLGSEGRMFKLKAQGAMDNDSDEDEDDQASARFSAPYPYLSGVDISEFPEDHREYLFEPDGPTPRQSKERDAQIQREGDVLMTFYTSRDEIPPTPAEPSEEPPASTVPPKAFGAIPESSKPEDVDFAARVEANQQAARSTSAAGPTPSAALSSSLNGLLASLSQNNTPAPMHGASQSPFNLNWTPNAYGPGYNPYPQAGAPNLSAILDQFATQPQAVQQAPAPSSVPDVSAILAAVQSSFGQPAPPPNMQPDWLQSNNAYATAAPVVPAFGQAPPALDTATVSNANHKRSRSEEEDDVSKRQKISDRGPQVSQSQPQQPTRGGYEPPKFILPCRFYKDGKCLKGANCTYRHDDD